MTPRKYPLASTRASERPLTEVELELMNCVWDLGECSVKDVQAALPKGRDLAYTSVATMLKILEQKGVLKSRRGERAHTYLAVVGREQYQSASLRHLAKQVFCGDPSSMVMKLLDDSRLSSDELQAIRRMLDERLGS